MLPAVIACLLWAFTSLPVPARTVGKTHLRRDEMFAYHEIAYQIFGNVGVRSSQPLIAQALSGSAQLLSAVHPAVVR